MSSSSYACAPLLTGRSQQYRTFIFPTHAIATASANFTAAASHSVSFSSSLPPSSSTASGSLSHVDRQGQPTMVDVGGKVPHGETRRRAGEPCFVCVPWLGRSISPVYVLSLLVCCLPSTLTHASTLNSSSISKLRPSLFLTFSTHIASLSSPKKTGKKNILLFLDHKFTRGQSPLPRRLPETNHG